MEKDDLKWLRFLSNYRGWRRGQFFSEKHTEQFQIRNMAHGRTDAMHLLDGLDLEASEKASESF